MSWKNITENFRREASKLPEEFLLSTPHFNLFDTVSAIPVNDPLMVLRACKLFLIYE
jgi:hypothetical protein